MSRFEVEKRNRNKTKYGFRTIFGLNEGRSGRVNWEGGIKKRRGAPERGRYGRWNE